MQVSQEKESHTDKHGLESHTVNQEYESYRDFQKYEYTVEHGYIKVYPGVGVILELSGV